MSCHIASEELCLSEEEGQTSWVFGQQMSRTSGKNALCYVVSMRERIYAIAICGSCEVFLGLSLQSPVESDGVGGDLGCANRVPVRWMVSWIAIELHTSCDGISNSTVPR